VYKPETTLTGSDFDALYAFTLPRFLRIESPFISIR
jgi:hypothetical protein